MLKLKKIFLLTLISFITQFSYGQWITETIDSPFDGSFKQSKVKSSTGDILVMEAGTSKLKDGTITKRPVIALFSNYFCDDKTSVDFVLTVNDINKKYKLSAIKSKNSTIYFLTGHHTTGTSLWASNNVWTEEFTNDFKNASKCFIRVNQDYCKNDIFVFDFSNSDKAYDFIME